MPLAHSRSVVSDPLLSERWLVVSSTSGKTLLPEWNATAEIKGLEVASSISGIGEARGYRKRKHWMFLAGE